MYQKYPITFDIFIVAYLIVKHLKDQGEYIFARGSVGSSFVAYLLGISEVNPLEPHYLCPQCHHIEFITGYSLYSGFNLPHKACPLCSSEMKSDGHNITYEIFMGLNGDKVPDIDLNVSLTAQDSVKKFLSGYFGKERIAYAGTISSIAPFTAEGYIRNYEEISDTTFSYEKKEYIIDKLCKIYTRSGLNPAGLLVLPEGKEFADFTPCCPTESFYLPISQKTAFYFHHLHDTIIKLDILGHIVPDIFKLLHKFTGISPVDVDIQDPEIYKIFSDVTALGISAEDIDGISVGTLGLPEYNNDFMRELLVKTHPKSFTDLVKIIGLAHGTDVWINNAEHLIEQYPLSKLITLRSDIMLDLMRNGVDKATAYKFDEAIRKGFLFRGRLSDEDVANFKRITKPLGNWYFDCCSKIRYMDPKAHAAAYVINASRLAWFKLYYPAEFYAAYLSVCFGRSEFNFNVLPDGLDEIDSYLNKMKSIKGEDSYKYKHIYTAMIAAKECIARGIKFLPPDIEKSDRDNYIPENGNIRIPL